MRRSFLEPIPELGKAIKLLDEAVDAVIGGSSELAAQLIIQSDMPEIREYTIRIVGPQSLEVHKQTKRPQAIPEEERDPARMPTDSIQRSIFSKDGWRCRFCSVPVISRKARSILIKLFPTEINWGSKEYARHAPLYSMAASLDHVHPHSRGGGNNIENFVTACYCCQFGRGAWLLEESELLDPRDFPPIVDSWDGLTRIETAKLTST